MANTSTAKASATHAATFLAGSVLCAGINNAILIAGDMLNIHYVALLVTCYFASSSVGYVYHCRITFDRPMHLNGYLNFVGGIWLGLPVSLALIAVMVEWLSWPMWIAAPTMTVIMFVYHYGVARLAIAKHVSRAD